MPTGPHKFGCGEIATGFKPSGFPPGFFNPRRVCPGGGKGNNPGGGNGGGGGDNPYKCVKEDDTCGNVHGNTKRCPPGARFPCIQRVKCEVQAVGSCNPTGPNKDPDCFASKKECEDAKLAQVTECLEYDDCRPFQDERWYCATQVIPCTGKDTFGSQYKRKCVECSVKGNTCGTHPTHKTEAECKKVCKSVGCAVKTQMGPMTGSTPYSCVETNDTIPCDVPGTTGGGFSVKKVKCLPCNCIINSKNIRVCTPAGPPAGNNPNPCPPNSTKVSCDADCKPKDCPEKYTKGTCYEHDRELCNLKEGKDPLKFKVINRCQSCSCFFNPNTSSEECYRQAIVSLPSGKKEPQGPHNIKDDCPLSTCTPTCCPDIDCPSTIATTTSLLTEF